MSDEELLALDPSQVVEEMSSEPDVEAEPQVQSDEVINSESPEQDVPEQTEEVTESDVFETQTTTEEPSPTVETVNDQEQEAKVETEDTNKDYEAFYKVITSPFKANGKEFQITDPNDAIRLMQQGINYSKKMEQLKPQQAVIKTLEQYDLLDNDKLSYLIDLYNKKPEAIAKLVKDSDIDLYSFDPEQANDYQPTQVVEPVNMLTETIESLVQESPEFLPVLDNIIDTWDTQSKQIISDNPHLLRIFNNHHQSGLFDKINNVIEYDRILGRLDGISYLQAYQEIEKRFINTTVDVPTNKSFTAPRPTQAKAVVNNNNNSSKAKAAMPNSKPTNNNNNNINPLTLSDEEFLKLELGAFS